MCAKVQGAGADQQACRRTWSWNRPSFSLHPNAALPRLCNLSHPVGVMSEGQ